MRYKIIKFVMPIITVIILLYFTLRIFNCPYVEDVSSCFPYNMPKWFPLFVIVSFPLLILLFIFITIKSKTPDNIQKQGEALSVNNGNN